MSGFGRNFLLTKLVRHLHEDTFMCHNNDGNILAIGLSMLLLVVITNDLIADSQLRRSFRVKFTNLFVVIISIADLRATKGLALKAHSSCLFQIEFFKDVTLHFLEHVVDEGLTDAIFDVDSGE